MRERDFGDSSRQTLAKIVLSLLALVTGCGIVLAARWLAWDTGQSSRPPQTAGTGLYTRPLSR